MSLNGEVMSFNVSNKGRDCTMSKQMEDGLSCHCLFCADQGLSPPPWIAGLIILRNGTALISDQCKRATFTVATPCHYTDWCVWVGKLQQECRRTSVTSIIASSCQLVLPDIHADENQSLISLADRLGDQPPAPKNSISSTKTLKRNVWFSSWASFVSETKLLAYFDSFYLQSKQSRCD